MFLKSSQLRTIDQYPYSLEDLKKDYPNTSFPDNFLTENNPNLQDYQIYFIVDNPPKLLSNQVIESKQPVYNNNSNCFEFEYQIREKTLEEIRQETFNPIQFMKDLLSNKLFNQWTELIPTKQFIILITAFNNGSFDTVQTIYNQLKLAYSLPENSDIQWQEIADKNGINLTF
jgi:hypothetical protein